METQKYAAKTYTGSSWQAPVSNTKNGLCLSGGGSRALAAGLGQLIGLRSINNGANDENGTLLDAIDYISSVSGGTWLTSIYTFSENNNLDDLVGVYHPPETLDHKNIAELPGGSIGHAPSKLSPANMLDTLHNNLGLWNIYRYPEIRKWIWPVIIGELVLKPYGLYQGSIAGSDGNRTPMPERFFTLDEAYMNMHIKALAHSNVDNANLSADDFYFHQAGRPYPIMNTNIKLDYQLSGSTLLPVQGTPIAIGATGKATAPGETLSTNGGVASFAFTSDYESELDNVATATVSRRYSLVDIVASSSAFFADLIGGKVAHVAQAYNAHSGLGAIVAALESALKQDEGAVLKDLTTLTPQYNYWPVGVAAPSNQKVGFSDGGTVDNTGLLGMLARSDATNIVVCHNTEKPLGEEETLHVAGYDKLIAPIDIGIPILFGYQPEPVNGSYILFSDDTPQDIAHLKAARIFASEDFGPLVTALFAASHGQTAPTTAYTPALQTRDNAFAGIKDRGTVNILWIYNNYATHWVDAIAQNSELLAEEIRLERHIPLSGFHNFPNYNTATQIHLDAKQVNALAQFQAWVIHQVSGQITEMFNTSD